MSVGQEVLVWILRSHALYSIDISIYEYWHMKLVFQCTFTRNCCNSLVHCPKRVCWDPRRSCTENNGSALQKTRSHIRSLLIASPQTTWQCRCISRIPKYISAHGSGFQSSTTYIVALFLWCYRLVGLVALRGPQSALRLTAPTSHGCERRSRTWRGLPQNTTWHQLTS